MLDAISKNFLITLEFEKIVLIVENSVDPDEVLLLAESYQGLNQFNIS